MTRTPAEFRQVFILCLAVPIVVGWMLSLVVWAYTRDVSALTLTTPLMLALLSGALGVSLTRKSKNGDG